MRTRAWIYPPMKNDAALPTSGSLREFVSGEEVGYSEEERRGLVYMVGFGNGKHSSAETGGTR